MSLPDRRLRLVALVAATVALAALNVLAARGTTRTVTTVATPGVAAASFASAEDLPTRGQRLFVAKGCVVCHVRLEVGPNLTGVAARAATTREGLGAEEYLRQSILEPAAYRAPTPHGATLTMPTIAVNDDELRALVAYLMTL